ncbi:uncharacterized protein JCM10292_004323 [Rhodotorula paludigena]|uniref:uncharacterized protein n=1 Tax=Rhodotorula paludigena TaxID=86838 RepID=UPI00316F4C1B
MSAPAVYSEPAYVHPGPATAIVGETRPTRLAPAALLCLNYLIDELLHLVVHAALHSPPSSTTPTNSPPGSTSPQNVAPSQLLAPLTHGEVLTTDRFKAALARILGPTPLAKECILEAELAVRELVRRGSPSLRGDGALRRNNGVWGSPVLVQSGAEDAGRAREVAQQAAEVFRAVRAWVMQISGVGQACPPGSAGPVPLQEHLAMLLPPRPPPADVQSPHVTFLLCLYVERVLSSLAAHLLRLVASVQSRSADSDLAGAIDVETAWMEDELVWAWLAGMRVRRFITDEANLERQRIARGSPNLGREQPGAGLPLVRKTSASATSIPATGAPPMAVGESARKPSFAGSTIAPTASRASFESSLTNTTAGPGSLAYGAKKGAANSFGLGISGSGSQANLAAGTADGAFDELLQSGRTLKLSSTPDRLRTFERNGRITGSSSLPASSAAPNGSPGSPGRRLRARDPQPRNFFNEEDEYTESAREELEQRPNNGRKESLMELISSAPPWHGPDGSAPPSEATASRRSSIVPRRPFPGDDPSHPMSVAMRVQDSQASVDTQATATSGSSYTPGSPRSNMRRILKAKDEKRDLASERQINNDLAEFFSHAPPPPPSRNRFPDFDEPVRTPSSPKKASKGGLRGFVSKMTGSSPSSRQGGEDGARTASPTSPGPPSYRSHAGSPPLRTSRSRSASVQSANGAPYTSPSQAAMRAAGFGDSVAFAAKAAAYAPPPGLGSPSASARQSRRSKSVVSTSSFAPTERSEPLPPLPPIQASEKQPVSIDSHTAAPPVDGNTLGLAPPIPPVPVHDESAIKPPKRSSSLKRNGQPREREASIASSSLAPATISPQRARETSGASTVSRNTSTSSRQLPEVESVAAPVTVTPAAAANADAPAPPMEVLAQPDPVLLAKERETLAAAQAVAAAAALAPALAVGAAQDVDAETAAAKEAGSPPVRMGVEALEKGTPLSPLEESPRPAPVSFAAHDFAAEQQQQQSPHGELLTAPEPDAQLRGSQGSTTPLSTPPMPSNGVAPALSPSASLLALNELSTATSAGAKSFVSLLRDLRGAMRGADTRDECLELVEKLLREQAGRVEALALRERGETETGQVRADEAEAEKEQAAVAEALLGEQAADLDTFASSEQQEDQAETSAVEEQSPGETAPDVQPASTAPDRTSTPHMPGHLESTAAAANSSGPTAVTA